MINELYQLSSAMKKAGIQSERWDREYKPLPNVRPGAPCVKIEIDGGSVLGFEAVDAELAKGLRKFGNNQGSFPGMNLCPLYRLTEEMSKERVKALLESDSPASFLGEEDLEALRAICVEANWNSKFRRKYLNSMSATPKRIRDILPDDIDCDAMSVLIEEALHFEDPDRLYAELERAAFALLERKTQVSLALSVLFHLGDARKSKDEDSGTLSVIIDSRRNLEMGLPAVSRRFTTEFNRALLRRDSAASASGAAEERDAFGAPYAPLQTPMPSVKLAGGFDAILRTMFEGQPCQERYDRFANESYPLSLALRTDLHAALNWLGSEERKNLHWMLVEKDVILFAYPFALPPRPLAFTKMFGKNYVDAADQAATFEACARSFLDEFKAGKKPGSDARSSYIQYFVLRKVSRGRTKVVYTRSVTAEDLETNSEAWTRGCENLPPFVFSKPKTLFPLEVAGILNRILKQDGSNCSEQYKPVPGHRGVALLLDATEPITQDLLLLVQNMVRIAPLSGRLSAAREKNANLWKITGMLALAGLLLYRMDIRKEKYMEQFPYLLGQLLKVSDELHALYCSVVREGDLPPQLVGSGLYQSVAETPIRSLQVLGQRMNPYITWAKSYRTRQVAVPGRESWRAGWYLSLFEKIATRLSEAWNPKTRLSDDEKAQFFIGYLAAFPKSERSDHANNSDESLPEQTENKEVDHE